MFNPRIPAVEEDGYYVYETNFLGNVSVIGDKEISEEPKEEPKKPDVIVPTPKPSVQGIYSGGVGGAGTGDATSIITLVALMISSTAMIFLLLRRKRKEE